MKKSLTLIGVAALLATVIPCFAGPTEGTGYQIVSTPNVAAQSSNTVPQFFADCSKQRNLVIQALPTCSVGGASVATNVIYLFTFSADNQNPNTNVAKLFALTAPLNGTSAPIVTTNIDTLGYGSIWLVAVTNTGPGILTNNLGYRVKVGFP
jgi:hypothetical protein